MLVVLPERPTPGHLTIYCGAPEASENAELLRSVLVDGRMELRRRVELAISGVRNPRMTADDACQETAMRLTKALSAGKFDRSRGENIWPFVSGVARHVVLEMQRALVRRERRQAAYLELKPERAVDPRARAEQEEMLRLVRERYLLLTDDQRDAMLATYPFLEPERTPADTSKRKRLANSGRAIRLLRISFGRKQD